MAWISALACALAASLASLCAADTFRVTLPPDAEWTLRPNEATSGRLLLFFIDATSRRLQTQQPSDAPFFEEPQPVASIAVENVKPGATFEFSRDAVVWPVPLDEFMGTFRLQAVLRINPHSASHLAPGNRRSPVHEVTLRSDADDVVELSLTETVAERPLVNPDPQFGERLVWVEFKSERLSRHFGRDVSLRAGVALPPDYGSDARGDRRWPALYIVPGFGGRHDGARSYARMLRTRNVMEITPNVVYIVLDPEGPFGHHGFADGELNGPVGEAFVRELIPHLEMTFGLVSAPEARLITGHSSGGWSALWLALNYPGTFGACWASAPDPIDFSAFQMTDLYGEENLFVDANGLETGSYRVGIAPGLNKVRMTTREEIGVEHAMAPLGDSGQQWGAWMAIFSSRDPQSGKARWMADPRTGLIDRSVIDRDWVRYDLSRLVLSNWDVLKSILPRLRIAVGTQDSYALNRAVARFQERVTAQLAKDAGAKGSKGKVAPTISSPPAAPADATPPSTPAAPTDAAKPVEPTEPAEPTELGTTPGEAPLVGGPGYIWFVRFATHDTIVPLTTLRWNSEMMEHLKAHGL